MEKKTRSSIRKAMIKQTIFSRHGKRKYEKEKSV